VANPIKGYIRSRVLSPDLLLPINKIFHKSFPQLLFIKRLVTLNLPKKLLEVNNSLKDKAETSCPFKDVRLANSKTGLDSEIIDLVILIPTPKSLQKDW